MRVILFGLPSSVNQEWELSHVPADGGAGLAVLITSALPETFRAAVLMHRGRLLNSWTRKDLEALCASSGSLEIVVVPDSIIRGQPSASAAPSIQLLTTSGPDSGRNIPLPRGTYSLGRGNTHLQIHDPYLSTSAAAISHSRHGVRLALPHRAKKDSPIVLRADADTPPWGRSRFRIALSEAAPVPSTSTPSKPEISPISEPTKPNLAIQAVTALSPVFIGTVMVLLTGHWFFLLFSLVSILIATVMIMQYRRARARFRASIQHELQDLVSRLSTAAPSATDFTLASRTLSNDPFGLQSLPSVPVLRWGHGCVIVKTDKELDPKWQPAVTTRIPLVAPLRSASINIVGDPVDAFPLERWIATQLLRFSLSSSLPSGSVLPVIRRYSDEEWATNPKNSNDEIVALCTERRLVLEGLQAEDVQFEGISHGTQSRLDHHLRGTVPRGAADSMRLLNSSASPRQAHDHLQASLGTDTLPLEVDLVDDGPHLLVVGTTGSGKSELLLSLLAHLTHDYSPTELGLILLDFKGGASFDPLAGLPHTMTVETNLLGQESFRSFSAITAELTRREKLFLAEGVADYASFRRRHPKTLLPRIVVAIDELRILFDEYPDAAGHLARLAATGRSLGFHLILATQRAQGTVTSEIRSNIGSNICLRTSTEQESWDLMGSGEAAKIRPEHPGRAYFRSGAASPREFQAVQPMCPDATPSFIPAKSDTISNPSRSPQRWHAVADYITNRCIAAGHPVPSPILTPELPQIYSPGLDSEPNASILGLLDEPAQRRQVPVLSPLSLPDTTAWIGIISDEMKSTFQRLFHSETRDQTSHAFIFDASDYLDRTSTGVTVADRSIDDEQLDQMLVAIERILDQGNRVTLFITAWGHWAERRSPSKYTTFEERTLKILRDYGSRLRFFVFGNRELAGGRLIAHINRRFFLPAGTTPEQRIVWPTLLSVPKSPLRAVMVTPDTAAIGLAVQLATLPSSLSTTTSRDAEGSRDDDQGQ